MIIDYILALIFGLVFGLLLYIFVSRREDKMMLSNAVKKIMDQDKTFVIDGKKIDLKGDVKRGFSSMVNNQLIEESFDVPTPTPLKALKKPKENLLEKSSRKIKKVIKKKVKKVKKKR